MLYPHIVTFLELPKETHELRTSHAVLVHAASNNNNNNSISNFKRAGVLFTGSMHARDGVGQIFALTFLST